MSRLRDVVFDCRHPASLARFWAAVLDGYDVAPYDDDALARLEGLGIDDPEDDPSVLVEAPGRTLRLWFQLVVDAKVAENRVHLDLVADDLDAEVARLVGLGAQLVDDQRGPDGGRVVLGDPEGNELCVEGTTGAPVSGGAVVPPR